MAKWEKKKKKKKKAATLGLGQLYNFGVRFRISNEEEKRKKERREIILNFFRSQQTGFCLEGLRGVGRTWNDSFLAPCFFFFFVFPETSPALSTHTHTHTRIYL